LGGSNSFSGGTFINGGTIVLSNDVANQFGLGTGAVTLNGGTLAMHDDASTANAAGWNLIVPTNSTGALNADSRCDLFGSLTGGGTFNFSVPSANTTLYGDWSAFTGTINVISGGDFRANNSAGYPNATIALSNNVNAYFSDVVDPNGTTLPIGALSGASSSTLLGGATAGNVFTWQIGGRNTAATFAGVIAEQNASAITAIEKIGSGTWTLTGNNTFSGGLTVSGGTLQVNNSSGSATGTNQLFVAEGATLSGSGSIGGLTVFDDNAILAPGNPLTINNELDLSDSDTLQFGLGTNSNQVVVSGDLNLGGQLNLTDNGGFGTGTYTLFTYGGALTLGNLTVASAPAGYFYSISTNTLGQVNLIVTRPQFNNISAGANGIVMSGSGGVANGTFYLLGSTNVALPLNLWTIIATNQFDTNGNFNFTNAISPNTPQSFYRLQLQ
jgi:autotransporter-associated beta strand protein